MKVLIEHNGQDYRKGVFSYDIPESLNSTQETIDIIMENGFITEACIGPGPALRVYFPPSTVKAIILSEGA